MKIKSYLLATMFAITLFSCSKDNDNGIENNSTSEKQIFNFSSEKEMQDKIAEIEAFRNLQEKQILSKNPININIKAPAVASIQKNMQRTLTDKEKTAMLDNVKFFHQEKLKAIYEERAYFGFTSIQSIADEINFLKLTDNDKSNQLYNKYSTFLKNNGYETTTIFNNETSLVINTEGALLVKKENISKKFLKKNLFKNTTNETERTIASGWLISGYNNFAVITYSTDINYSYIRVIDYYETQLITKYDQNGDSHIETIYVPVYKYIATYKPVTTLSAFVLSPYGYVLFGGSYFYTNPTSYAKFNAGCSETIVPFAGGFGNSVTSAGPEKGYAGNNCSETVNGSISGVYAIPVPALNTFLWLTGNKNF